MFAAGARCDGPAAKPCCTVQERAAAEDAVQRRQAAEYLYISFALGRCAEVLRTGHRRANHAVEQVGEIGLISARHTGRRVHALRDSLMLRSPRRPAVDFVVTYPGRALLEMPG